MRSKRSTKRSKEGGDNGVGAHGGRAKVRAKSKKRNRRNTSKRRRRKGRRKKEEEDEGGRK